MLGLFLSGLISTVAAAVVGARLLGVARRTRQLPELSVGVGLAAFALAQVGAMLAAVLHDSLPPGASQALKGFTLFQFSLVAIGLAVFTVETFGRTAWRCAMAAAIIAAGAAVRIAVFFHDSPMMGAGAPRTVLPSLAAATFALGFAWMGGEALHYHRKARRAYEIGLASPEVVNRFLVLGLGGLASGALAAGAAAAALTRSSGPATLFIIGGGLVNAVTWVLTFVPPAAYRRFVESRASRGATSHG